MCTRDLFIKSKGCNENIFIQDESLALNLSKYSKKIISSDLHSVFVILDETETKSIRGENRLSRHLEQQHHDMFFTIDDFIRDYPDIAEQNKKLLIKKSNFNLLEKYTPYTPAKIYRLHHLLNKSSSSNSNMEQTLDEAHNLLQPIRSCKKN